MKIFFNNNLKRKINVCRYFFGTNTKAFKDYSKLNYYERLGVNPSATAQELKGKFLQLAKEFHPDKYKGPDTDTFKYIKEAYETLRNPQKRKEYNKAQNIHETKIDDFGAKD